MFLLSRCFAGFIAVLVVAAGVCAIPGDAAPSAKLPTVPKDAKVVHVAQTPTDPSHQPNVRLSLTVDGKLHFSEQSYKPATATTPAGWVHCNYCGKIQGHDLKTLNPWVELKFGSRSQTVVYASYIYQEYDLLTRIFLDRDAAVTINPHWGGWKLWLDIVAFGPHEYIRVMSVGLYDPSKPPAPDLCGSGCGMK
jgi:hypothetical protein